MGGAAVTGAVAGIVVDVVSGVVIAAATGLVVSAAFSTTAALIGAGIPAGLEAGVTVGLVIGVGVAVTTLAVPFFPSGVASEVVDSGGAADGTCAAVACGVRRTGATTIGAFATIGAFLRTTLGGGGASLFWASSAADRGVILRTKNEGARRGLSAFVESFELVGS